MTGITTITVDSNYGNRLQNYAVQSALNNLGVESATVFYKKPFIRLLKNFVKILIGRNKIVPIHRKRDARFHRFNRKYFNIIRIKKSHLGDLHDKLDNVVCGSDQIWNFTFPFITDNTDLLFAKFVEPEKRIAFSASIGTDSIPEEHKQEFIDGINGMKAISVREERGREIIKELTGRDVPVTVDPTLLLSRDEWRKIEKKPSFVGENDRYLLTYFLGGCSEEVRDYIEGVARANGLKVIDLYNEFLSKSEIENKKWFVADPGEFVWLIDHCQLLMTDSFHGCVFSIINEVPFRCFKRGGKAANMSSRMNTLFGKLNISDWCIGDITESLEHVLYKDYTGVKDIIEKEKAFAYNYLKGALNIE